MKIAYGNDFLELKLPSGLSFDVIEPPRTVSPSTSLRDRIEQALAKPAGFPPLEEYVRGKSKVLLAVPDTTRPCPLPEILPIVVECLQRVSRVSVRVVVANGTHRSMAVDALRSHVGTQIFDRWEVLQHDAYAEGMIEVGRTRRGTVVIVNPVLLDAEAIIAIGPVQHHYFAGFGGGPKLIVPGLAAAETTVQNHKLVLTERGYLRSECREGIIDGNPVALDIYEAVSLCPPALHLGLNLGADGQVTDILAGGFRETHRALAEKYHRAHLCIVDEKRPIVIASAGGAPRDCNLIQAHKGLHRAFRLVVPGGTLVYFARCESGVGSDTLLQWFEFSSRSDMAKELTRNYTLNGHTALALREKADMARIVLVSDLSADVTARIGVKSVSPSKAKKLDLRELADWISEGKGWMLPQAGEVLPVPRDELRPEDSPA
jgi:nickel-dependent lactate racemase